LSDYCITKNTMFEEGGRFAAFRAAVLLQPPTSGPAAGFCPWLGQQMTLFRHEVVSVALADGQTGRWEPQEQPITPRPPVYFRVSALLAFRSFLLLLLLHSCHPGIALRPSNHRALPAFPLPPLRPPFFINSAIAIAIAIALF
jgi:hypothetical protein